ncbi:unnamed protein product [Triticum turgidum subsp. durum]|uniref:Inositol-tetrakisphosphate 1-kinase 6 n=1 Tax=Triticum turgidum subsp. durum TaxID=4567 RepID=A0A9R0TWS8_TRITD|nr:unnamed protein product [Triticum turgidum subsp. durum]
MAMERPVRLVLDASLLLDPVGAGAQEAASVPTLRPGAEALLRRLRHSNLGVAICHTEEMPTTVMNQYIQLDLFPDAPVALITLDVCQSFLLLNPAVRVDEDLFSELESHNWKVIAVDSECGTKDSGVVNIGKLQELLITLATLIKKRGAFPIYPSENGLIFVPLSFELPLASQLLEVDIILHKMTDEIITIDPNCSISFPRGISFSAGMSEVIRFMEEYPDFCIIDPFKNISPLLDRLQIQEILVRLQELGSEGRPKLRAPHSLKVIKFNGSELQKQLAEANLSFPLIVKPQVACGVADAHNMALVFQIEEFSNLSVPLPAILQEYIDHGSKIYKFYVIGDKVFHAVKTSMPNANLLKSSSGDEPLTFNSLKTLPVATKEQLLLNRVHDNKSLNIGVVEEAAKLLKESLGLTIFGFDVVVQEGSGDHVIVDLNYLPSFKEVPDSEAMPAFWDAIRQSYESKKGKIAWSSRETFRIAGTVLAFCYSGKLPSLMEHMKRFSGMARGTPASAPARKDEDESLLLFGELYRHDQEKEVNLLDPMYSVEFEAIQGDRRMFKLASGKRDYLLTDGEKNDYDWLKTPPATPLFASLEMEADSAQMVFQRELPILQPVKTSRFSGKLDALSSTSTKSESPTTSSSSKSATPTARPSSSSEKNLSTRGPSPAFCKQESPSYKIDKRSSYTPLGNRLQNAVAAPTTDTKAAKKTSSDKKTVAPGSTKAAKNVADKPAMKNVDAGNGGGTRRVSVGAKDLKVDVGNGGATRRVSVGAKDLKVDAGNGGAARRVPRQPAAATGIGKDPSLLPAAARGRSRGGHEPATGNGVDATDGAVVKGRRRAGGEKEQQRQQKVGSHGKKLVG